MKAEIEHTPLSRTPAPVSSPRWTRVVVTTALAWAFCASYSLTFRVAAQSPQSVWDGVYTEEQADRGKAVAASECAPCHTENLTGSEIAPSLVGGDFMTSWSGQTVGDLFERARTSMPADGPGRLSRQQYADVVSFILKSNKFPAGQKELDKDDTSALKQMKIEAKK